MNAAVEAGDPEPSLKFPGGVTPHQKSNRQASTAEWTVTLLPLLSNTKLLRTGLTQTRKDRTSSVLRVSNIAR